MNSDFFKKVLKIALRAILILFAICLLMAGIGECSGGGNDSSADNSELQQEIDAITKEINSLNLKEDLGDDEKQQVDEIMDKVKTDDKDNLSALITDLNTLVQYKIKEEEKELADETEKEKDEEKKNEELQKELKEAQDSEKQAEENEAAAQQANQNSEQSEPVSDSAEDSQSTESAAPVQSDGSAQHMCRDGTPINYDANVHAKGKANACYGHKGFQY